jgi:hypothetical protein
MRGLDHQKPGKRRFGLGDSPTDVDGKKKSTPNPSNFLACILSRFAA